MGRRARAFVLAGLAIMSAASSCSVLSGVDQLEKVQCLETCDASSAGGDATRDAPSATGDAPADSSGATDSSLPDSSNSVDSGVTDSSNLKDSSDSADSAPPPDSSGFADSGAAADAASAYRAAVLADGPVGYWRLGDPAGSTSCHDETGNAHDGVVVGGVLLGKGGALTGESSTAAQFDGTGSIDVGVSFIFTGAAAFSWEIWVQPTVLNGNFCPFLSCMTYDTNDDPVDGTYMVSYSTTGLTFGFERYNGGTGVLGLDTEGLNGSVWTYIVASSDALGNGVVYMNGSSVSTDTNVGSVPSYVAHTIIGMQFSGELDEVAIYNHALSAQAVLNHWNASKH